MHSEPDLLHVFWSDLATQNPQFVPPLEAIVGHDPAVLEFSVIVVRYGARNQRDHQDVTFSGSAALYSRTFFPSYSLIIPLQDTTSSMGATQVCPGTHVCADSGEQRCSREGNAISVADITGDGIWKKGGGRINDGLCWCLCVCD
jgi:ectoine hydroxylase-related dioxygenase (phytanoyl-CoA dioxygenase family)